MNLPRLDSLLFAILAPLGVAGCSVPLPEPEAPAQMPLRWIMVEKRADQVYSGSVRGDGQVDPSSTLITMVPLYREDLEWKVVVSPPEYTVEVLEILPSPEASPGETVSATVRVGRAVPGERYLLTAKARTADVHILGAREQIVSGNNPAVFRFTSLAAGPGGIGVSVERID